MVQLLIDYQDNLFLLYMMSVFVATLLVNGILKLNLKLEKMQKMAEELQKLSVHLGENISRNVLDRIEKQENTKQRAEEVRVKQIMIKDILRRIYVRNSCCR